MNILFSTTAANVQTELDAKFPTETEQNGCKFLLFAKLRNSHRLPVRFLQDTQDGLTYQFLVDVPTATDPSDVDSEVAPFVAANP